MKITILGGGNAGCFTALHFAYYTTIEENINDVQIELIHDKNILPEKVCQATFPEPPQLLWSALGIDWYNNPIDATIKTGILYENWGKKKETFMHPFPFDTMGIHFSPKKLQETVLKCGLFEVSDRNVNSYDDIDSDYIFDCRGRPILDNISGWGDYIPLDNPLNAVILGQSQNREPNINWTRTVATPDGWTFVIPNTTNTTSYGYLYNHDITSDLEAEENFTELFDVVPTDKLRFKNYVARTPIIDNRIILNGNKLFFLEPLEATAFTTYLDWARIIYSWIFYNESPIDAAEQIKKQIFQIKNFILWHYQFGSKYDTPFWNYAKTLLPDDPEMYDVIQSVSQMDDDGLFVRGKDNVGYGIWQRGSVKNWYDGVVI